MGRRSKGLDAIRQNNMLKKQMLGACRKYAEQLEKENYDLKNDPGTIIGQFIGQFRELYSQNQRLSVLSASFLRKLGEKVVLTKEEMESFKDKKINIKWEIADGETIETATSYTFSYELLDAPPQGQPVQETEQPGVIGPTVELHDDPETVPESNDALLDQAVAAQGSPTEEQIQQVAADVSELND